VGRENELSSAARDSESPPFVQILTVIHQSSATHTYISPRPRFHLLYNSSIIICHTLPRCRSPSPSCRHSSLLIVDDSGRGFGMSCLESEPCYFLLLHPIFFGCHSNPSFSLLFLQFTPHLLRVPLESQLVELIHLCFLEPARNLARIRSAWYESQRPKPSTLYSRSSSLIPHP
jgi:hypothetical protein